MSTKTIFSCQKCGAQTAKWAGRCSECGAWGTLTEEIKTQKTESKITASRPAKPMALNEIKSLNTNRLPTGIEEVDRVLGSGIVAGSTILLAGEPGIGKSTLVAQIASVIARSEAIPRLRSGQAPQTNEIATLPSVARNDILYISGEESPEQLKERFDRLSLRGEKDPSTSLGTGSAISDRHASLAMTNKNSSSDISILSETNAETIVATIEHERPILTIIDSVQTLSADAAEDAGAITQLRASTSILNETAKRTGLPILLIGQVTKSLDIAGPKSLEHLVDTVLTFEGDRGSDYRILRAEKNRFGGTGEIGVFEMSDSGLREVKNPSAAFLKIRSDAPGSIATCVLQGSRPILVEVQALASKSYFPYPERRSSGFDLNRLNLLLAVLEKTIKSSKIGNYNIHLNVTSGLKINEPAADLAVILAIISSLNDKTISQDVVAFGEVGLGGELRPVREMNRRISEGRKLNSKIFILPAGTDLKPEKDIHCFSHLSQVIQFLNLT